MRLALATVSVCLPGRAWRAGHAWRVCAKRPPANCLLFSRGRRIVGLQSTHWGPVFAQLHSVFTCYLRTPSRPHCTAAAPAPALRNNTFVYPELIAHPAGAIKNLGPHVQGYAHKPGTLRHWKITCLFFSWVFFFCPEKAIVISPGPMRWPVCGGDLCVISGYQNGVT